MDTTLYTYEPLESERRFRLLELRRTEGRELEPLRGVLREASIDVTPGYVALSYVWGPPEFTDTIEIEGHRLPITPSLCQALQAVRPRLGALDWPTLIWTDAVCINQSDVDERAAQVCQMRQIYENAGIVVAWLGPSPCPSDGFTAMTGIFHYITLYLKKLSDLEVRARPLHELTALFDETARALMTDANGLLHLESQAAIEHFFARPWFHRAWIVQEATGTLAVLLCLGQYQVSLPVVVNLSRMLHSLRHHQGIDRYDRGYIRGVALFNMGESRRDGQMKRVDTLLQSFRDRGATDARDKVYAALGIVTDDNVRNFKIDYSENYTVSKVYYEFAIYLLKTSKRLDWLGSDNRPPSETGSDLPSWVPDWRCRSTALDLDKSWDPIRASMQDDANRMYNADSGLSRSPLVSDSGYLEVEGLWVDTISRLEGRATDSHSNLEIERSWCPSTKDDPYQFTSEKEFDAYLRTLVADIAQVPPGLNLARGQRMDWAMLSASSPHDHLEATDATVRMVSANLLDRLKTVTMNRCFARTQHLRLMGLVPMFTVTGDAICVIAGCSVPLVMRRGAEGHWQLIGQAYIHGLMDGLAHELVQKNERVLETMIIE